MKQPDIIIPVYRPSLTGNEKVYINDCLDSSWISSKGKYIAMFEHRFREYINVHFAAAVCNGTAAMHLALLALGIQAGDEVIVPTLTYIATVNPVMYMGAQPVFVDADRKSWQMDPMDIRNKITAKTRAIIVVHLYGYPADMSSIMTIAREHNLLVIEDCAEALGTRIDGRHVGSFGDISAFSFFGNKTITTGEGGMVVTNDPGLHERVLRFKGQGLAKHRVYWHDIIGYNYRMTNICAALGYAQMEQIETFLARKRLLAKRYDELLVDLELETHNPSGPGYEHSYWMYSILTPEGIRDDTMAQMAAEGIETRPVFHPVHTMPMYASRYQRYQMAEEISRRGINLPSWPDLREEDLQCVADSIRNAFKRYDQWPKGCV